MSQLCSLSSWRPSERPCAQWSRTARVEGTVSCGWRCSLICRWGSRGPVKAVVHSSGGHQGQRIPASQLTDGQTSRKLPAETSSPGGQAWHHTVGGLQGPKSGTIQKGTKAHLFLLFSQAVPHGGHNFGHISKGGAGILPLDGGLSVSEEESVG